MLLHASSRLTFMVDIVTFAVGTISVFLVGNIEVFEKLSHLSRGTQPERVSDRAKILILV